MKTTFLLFMLMAAAGWADGLYLDAMTPPMGKRALPGAFEVSGCAYSRTQDLVFVVQDYPEAIRAYTRSEVFVHAITLQGFSDTEGICVFNEASNILAVVEEALNEIHLITYSTNVTNIVRGAESYVSMGLGDMGDDGIEGLAYDPANNCFYAAEEKPPRVFRVTGTGTQAVTELLFNVTNATDLSGLHFDPSTRRLVALSEENNLVLEYDLAGRLYSTRSLTFWKAEGVAMSPDAKQLFVVGEANEYQRFIQPDTDSDGLSDAWETDMFENLLQTAAQDPDRDGVSNRLEERFRSDPTGRAAPAWWFARSVVNTNASAADFAALNQGQVKWIATNAFDEMEVVLDGGAGSNLAAMVASISDAHNYAGINLGQLKSLAKPFYDRLIAVGLADGYPWTGAAVTNDYALANIGQAKHLFSFKIE